MRLKIDIVSVLYGLEPGGAEISTRLLLEQLAGEGIDARVVSSRPQAALLSRTFVLQSLSRVPTPLILFGANRVLDALFRSAFLRLWRERRPDVVLIEDHLGIVGAVAAVRQLRREGHKIVLAMTQMWEVDSEFLFAYRPWPIAFPAVRRFRVANALAKEMDLVNGATSYMRSRVIDRLGVSPDRCKVFHTVGVVPGEPPAAAEVGAPPRPLLLAPGRMTPEKGSFFFLDVVRALAKRRRDFDAVFLGGGPSEPAVRRAIEAEGLGDVCRVTGRIPYDEFKHLYRSATAVAIPIMYPSAYTRVVLESLQAGKPIITFAHGSMPEIIRDDVTGFCVPPHDVEAFAKACERFIDRPERSLAMSTDCREAARVFGDLPEAARALVAQFERMIAGEKEGVRG